MELLVVYLLFFWEGKDHNLCSCLCYMREEFSFCFISLSWQNLWRCLVRVQIYDLSIEKCPGKNILTLSSKYEACGWDEEDILDGPEEQIAKHSNWVGLECYTFLVALLPHKLNFGTSPHEKEFS